MIAERSNTMPVGIFPLSDPNLKWFVVYTKPLTEKKVAARLMQLGYEVYLPLFTTLKQWSDRKKKLEKPLINSVVFVRCQPAQLNGLYQVQSVSGILRQDSKPAEVRHH